MTNKYKYRDFKYSAEVLELLNIPLTEMDKKLIHQIEFNILDSKGHRNYSYIIKDIYILIRKHNLTTKQLSSIYRISETMILRWLKELDLNRSIKEGIEAKKTSEKKNLFLGESNINNIITNNQILNKFGINIENSDSPQILNSFLNYLETIKGKSINTIHEYKKDLIIFFRFLAIYKGLVTDSKLEFDEIPINNISDDFMKSITLMDIYAFLTFAEKSRNNQTKTRARKVASLKSFFKFLQTKAKIIKENPTLELEIPKTRKNLPIHLSLDESMQLLNNMNKNSKNYYRDYCIITLFLNTGMRLSELCSIDMTKIKNDTLTIIGKGNKERIVYLNQACLKAINDYLSVRDDSKVSFEEKKFLFISAKNRKINQRTVEMLIKKHVQSSGLTNLKYTPHKLRHTAATLMYKHGGVDIRSIQGILGHENISTTQIYVHVDDDGLRDAVKSNPLANINK